MKNQGAEGSCTAQASCAQREYLARRYQGKSVTLSPQFFYYMERKFEGTLGEDAGAQVRTSVKLMDSQGCGCCSIEDYPHIAGQIDVAPTTQQLQNALQWRAGAYHSLGTVADMKSCMASGYGFVAGFNVYESFESPDFAANGIMPLPKHGEKQLGGHEVFFVDYNDAMAAFLAQNSWGTGWGISGFFWFPYQAAADSSILTDARIQHLGRPW